MSLFVKFRFFVFKTGLFYSLLLHTIVPNYTMLYYQKRLLPRVLYITTKKKRSLTKRQMFLNLFILSICKLVLSSIWNLNFVYFFSLKSNFVDLCNLVELNYESLSAFTDINIGPFKYFYCFCKTFNLLLSYSQRKIYSIHNSCIIHSYISCYFI